MLLDVPVSCAPLKIVLVVESPLTACATVASPTLVEKAVTPFPVDVMTLVIVLVSVDQSQPCPQAPQGDPPVPPLPQPPGPPAHGDPFHSQPVTV